MQRAWRVKPVLPLAKLLGAAALVLLALGLGQGAAGFAAGGVVAAGLAVWAVRDLVAPVRLAADPDGVTVITGFAGRRRLAWSQIERVRLDRRDRLGLSTELLEIDTGGTLHLLSVHDLGAPPAEVADALAALRPD
jgi:hypothetical protein